MTSSSAPSRPEAIGLIAGGGTLPLILAKAVKGRGHPLVCFVLEGANAALSGLADFVYPVQFGQMQEVMAALQRHSARRVLVLGRVSRTQLLDHGDQLFRRWLTDAADRRDQTVFAESVRRMRDLGVDVISPLEFAPELAVPAGVLTRRTPAAPEWDDIMLGMTVARTVAALDAGQTVVLKRGVILAVEAAEGTDATIRRGGSMAGGTVVVKAARPNQDPRFDLPTIGAQTITLLHEVGAAALAVDAGKTLMLDRVEALAAADRAGIAVVGVEIPTASDP